MEVSLEKPGLSSEEVIWTYNWDLFAIVELDSGQLRQRDTAVKHCSCVMWDAGEGVL